MARKKIWSPSKVRASMPRFPLPDVDHRTEFFSIQASPMIPSVMCTSVRQAKSCTSLPGIPRSVLCATELIQGLQSLPAQSPSVPPVSKDVASAAVWMKRVWNGCGLSAHRALQKSLAQASGLGRTLICATAKTGMACGAFACDGSGGSTVRHSCEQQVKISSAS